MVPNEQKEVAIRDISFLTKIADTSRFTPRFVIFSSCKKSKCICVKSLIMFSLFRRAVSPPPRGFEAAKCARTPAPSGVFGQPLAIQNRHTKQSDMPLYRLRILLVPRGLRSALIRCISSHGKMSRIVILFSLGKSY